MNSQLGRTAGLVSPQLKWVLSTEYDTHTCTRRHQTRIELASFVHVASLTPLQLMETFERRVWRTCAVCCAYVIVILDECNLYKVLSSFDSRFSTHWHDLAAEYDGYTRRPPHASPVLCQASASPSTAADIARVCLDSVVKKQSSRGFVTEPSVHEFHAWGFLPECSPFGDVPTVCECCAGAGPCGHAHQLRQPHGAEGAG